MTTFWRRQGNPHPLHQPLVEMSSWKNSPPMIIVATQIHGLGPVIMYVVNFWWAISFDTPDIHLGCIASSHLVLCTKLETPSSRLHCNLVPQSTQSLGFRISD